MKFKKYTKVGAILLLCLCLSAPVYYKKERVKADVNDIEEMIKEYFTIIDENGNTQTIYYDEIKGEQEVEAEVEQEIQQLEKQRQVTAKTQNINIPFITTAKANEPSVADIRAITKGIAYITTKKSYIEYREVATGNTGYTAGSYGVDAAYLGQYNGKARIKISGVIADVNTEDVTIVNYDENQDVSYYTNSNGYLVHNYYYGSSHNKAGTRVGYALDYLQDGKKYYSYDGHYFYDDYIKMLDDYQNGSKSQAVNPTNPYYNYYQYLSHRSKSSLSGDQINQIVINQLGESQYSASKLSNLGQVFVDAQNKYGVNAFMSFGVSVNESNWGRSTIAKEKNNLFGHNAVDNDPYVQAYGYRHPQDSVIDHAKAFVSEGYLDCIEDSRYRGGHLGDKQAGMNVKYASDPYWGEKAAARVYYLDNKPSDYNSQAIGIIAGVCKNQYMHFKADKNAGYAVGVKKAGVEELPVIILDAEIDSNGEKWYKIQTDSPLVNGSFNWRYDYDFNRDVAYIRAKEFSVVINADKIGETVNPEVTPPTPQPTYKKGDVNGDGKVEADDYMLIKLHVLGRKQLPADYLARADIDGDSKIEANDYMLIKLHVLGRKPLE